MKTIEQYIAEEMNGKIASKSNSPLVGLIILAVGIVFFLLLRFAKMSDSLMTASLTVGFIATAVGFILTAMCLSGALTHYVYLPTRSRMREKKLYLSQPDYLNCVEGLQSGDLRVLHMLQPVTSSNSLLRVLSSRDGAIRLVQVGRMDGATFDPATDVVLLTGEEALRLQL